MAATHSAVLCLGLCCLVELLLVVPLCGNHHIYVETRPLGRRVADLHPGCLPQANLDSALR